MSSGETNLDRIRAMNAEEMVAFFGYSKLCTVIPFSSCEAGDMSCEECVAKWLNKPLEE